MSRLFSIPLLLLCWTLPVDALDVSLDNAPGDGIWRTPEREGANALYLWLRLNDVPIKYDEIVALSEQYPRPISLAYLKDTARRKGLNAVVRRGDTDDIIKQRAPVIAYLDGDDGRHGFFVLVILVNDQDDVILVNTSTVFLTSMRGDDFRRVWTGHYLSVAPSWSITPWWTSGLVVAIIFVVRHRYCRGSGS